MEPAINGSYCAMHNYICHDGDCELPSTFFCGYCDIHRGICHEGDCELPSPNWNGCCLNHTPSDAAVQNPVQNYPVQNYGAQNPVHHPAQSYAVQQSHGNTPHVICGAQQGEHALQPNCPHKGKAEYGGYCGSHKGNAITYPKPGTLSPFKPPVEKLTPL